LREACGWRVACGRSRSCEWDARTKGLCDSHIRRPVATAFGVVRCSCSSSWTLSFVRGVLFGFSFCDRGAGSRVSKTTKQDLDKYGDLLKPYLTGALASSSKVESGGFRLKRVDFRVSRLALSVSLRRREPATAATPSTHAVRGARNRGDTSRHRTCRL